MRTAAVVDRTLQYTQQWLAELLLRIVIVAVSSITTFTFTVICALHMFYLLSYTFTFLLHGA